MPFCTFSSSGDTEEKSRAERHELERMHRQLEISEISAYNGSGRSSLPEFSRVGNPLPAGPVRQYLALPP